MMEMLEQNNISIRRGIWRSVEWILKVKKMLSHVVCFISKGLYPYFLQNGGGLERGANNASAKCGVLGSRSLCNNF